MDRTIKQEIALDENTSIYIRYESEIGAQDVKLAIPNFKDVTKVIQGIGKEISHSLKSISPSKATVEFGIELSAESGELTSILVKGEGKANLKITLEWNEDD